MILNTWSMRHSSCWLFYGFHGLIVVNFVTKLCRSLGTTIIKNAFFTQQEKNKATNSLKKKINKALHVGGFFLLTLSSESLNNNGKKWKIVFEWFKWWRAPRNHRSSSNLKKKITFIFNQVLKLFFIRSQFRRMFH